MEKYIHKELPWNVKVLDNNIKSNWQEWKRKHLVAELIIFSHLEEG